MPRLDNPGMHRTHRHLMRRLAGKLEIIADARRRLALPRLIETQWLQPGMPQRLEPMFLVNLAFEAVKLRRLRRKRSKAVFHLAAAEQQNPLGVHSQNQQQALGAALRIGEKCGHPGLAPSYRSQSLTAKLGKWQKRQLEQWSRTRIAQD